MSQYTEGEFMPLYWDCVGEPPAYYVYGHVDDRQFAQALAVYYGSDFPSGALTIKRSYARIIPVRGQDHDNEIRDCGPGRVGQSEVFEFDIVKAMAVLDRVLGAGAE